MHICLWVTLYDNVHMYYSNIQLTNWVGGNEPVHVEKINKWNVQHYYVTSSQKIFWEVLQYDNISQKNVVSNWTEKVSTYIDGIRPSFLLILASLPMSDNVRQCAHVHSNSQLTRWVGGMNQFMWKRKYKWNNIFR